MSQDEFTKLFKYMEGFRKEVNEKFEHVDTRFDGVSSQIDGLAKLITDYHQEMLMLAHKVDRLEGWIHEIAQKTGVKLSYK
jgi:hypothetical protein